MYKHHSRFWLATREITCNNWHHYMASSTSGQDDSKPALWLATQAGKIELSCLLENTCRIPQGKVSSKPSFIDQAHLVKMAGYWSCSFFVCLWTSTQSWPINMQKKELGQYPAILTSRLVNNPYIIHFGSTQLIEQAYLTELLVLHVNQTPGKLTFIIHVRSDYHVPCHLGQLR